MGTIRLTLPTPHTGQLRIIRESNRFNVAACGRRFGKTVLGINRLIVPETLHLPQAWFSPTYKMMLEVWREIKETLTPITTRSNSTERRIELVTGGVIEFWSLDKADSGRGRKYARMIVDEAAYVNNLMGAWNNSLRPMLADYQGSAYFLSTPNGLNGFYTLFQWGLDTERGEWASFQMPTSTNPHIAPSEIEAMRQSMPELSYRQEVLAEFVDSAGTVFRRVREAATVTPRDEPTPNHTYMFGVDWGQMNDFTVITVLDITTNEVVYIDRFNQIDYSIQFNRLSSLADRFRPLAIIAESNSIGQPIIDALQLRGMPVQPFMTTNASKAQAIQALQLAFERGDIKIPNDETLISELTAFSGRRTASGLMTYSAPDGLHDDMVMSLAIVWSGNAQHMPMFL